ncbi:MAG: polysaccharide deacetylase family protein [Verrucomicrobiota bacterium]
MFRTIERRPDELGLPKKTIIMSFDDGPVPGGQSVELLDLLKTVEVPAAFCLVGRRIPGNEDVVRRIHDEGHLIVNHGQRHRMPEQMTAEEFRSDLEDFDRSVRKALGIETCSSRFFRPPGGQWNSRIERMVEENDRELMPITFFGWDVFKFPFRQRLILHGMLSSLRRNDGGIFLIHEAVVPLRGEKDPAPARAGRRWIVPLVEKFVIRARTEGFSFVDPRDI